MEPWEGDQVHGYLIQVHIEGTFKPRGTDVGGKGRERKGIEEKEEGERGRREDREK